MNAELSARRTAAAAVRADFEREAQDFMNDDSLQLPTPNWCQWAMRLSEELRSLLDGLADGKPDQAAGQLAQIRLVLDSFCWETDDRQYALEQIDDILRSGQ